MFSGLTNQFTSLVGAVKGGQADEDVPAPPPEAAAAEATAAAAASTATAVEQTAGAAAPTAEGGVEGEEGAKSGWLGSAKGWLGSASASIPSMPAMPSMPSIPSMPAMPAMPSIPGLRKGGAENAEGDAAAGGEPAENVGGGVSAEDDDKSSATEGADSHPASGGGTPTGEEGQIGQGKGDEVKITTKVTQQAKHFGSFLSSAINKAGAKIKETVKDNNILDSFNKEQEAFIKGQGGANSGAAPWIGHANEAKIKEEILGLSQDRRNFVRAPPAGVDFEFNYDTAYPTAIAIMAEDKALETMRFELVPKIITEENFWRNYFYRVSLIIQAAELGTLGADGVGQASSGEDVNAKNDQTVIMSKQTGHAQVITTQIPALVSQLNVVAEDLSKSGQDKKEKIFSESEFVSDDFLHDTNESDLEEVKDGMRKLGIDSMTQQAISNDEEQWEKDLEAELKDYEVVSDATSRSGTGTGGGGGGGGGGISRRNTATTSSSNNGDHNQHEDKDDELPTIANLRTRSTTNDWEEYADLIEDTDDLK